jgi:hypothetical protein
MKRLISHFVVTVLIATLGSGGALAQSSRSFSAMGTGPSCQLSGEDGTFSGGYENVGSFAANVQTSNGSGLLLIRPSLVTGLFTDERVNQQQEQLRDVRGDCGRGYQGLRDS